MNHLSFYNTLMSQIKITLCIFLLHFICILHAQEAREASHWEPSFFNEKEILFYSYSLSEDGIAGLYKFNLETKDLTSLAKGTTHYWFPTVGKKGKITFSSDSLFQERYGGSNIYILDSKKNKITEITHYKDRMATHSSFSPDGKSILFMEQKSWGKGNCEIKLYNIKTNKITNLSNHPARDELARWSPDGKKVLFTSDRSGSAEIYLLNLRNKELEALTDDPQKTNQMAIWSPDGQTIAYSTFFTEKGPQSERYLVLLEMSSGKEIDSIRIDRNGKWLRQLSWSPDGHKIIGSFGTNDLSEIWMLDLESKEWEKVAIPF